MASSRTKTVLLLTPIASLHWAAGAGDVLTLPVAEANDLFESEQAIPINSKDRDIIQDLKDRLGLIVKPIATTR